MSLRVNRYKPVMQHMKRMHHVLFKINAMRNEGKIHDSADVICPLKSQ